MAARLSNALVFCLFLRDVQETKWFDTSCPDPFHQPKLHLFFLYASDTANSSQSAGTASVTNLIKHSNLNPVIKFITDF